MNPDTIDKVLIWGAGAIGSIVGAHLARAGCDVTLVDVAPAQVKAIRERGVAIVGDLAQFTQPIPIHTPEELEGRWPLVMLAVKSQFTDVACAAFVPHLEPEGCVLSLQNGLNADLIARHVGRHRTYIALGSIVGDVLSPGETRFGGINEIPIGRTDGREDAMLTAIVNVMRQFEPDSFATPDIQSYLWGKHCFNSLTCASALAASPIAELLARESLLPLWRSLVREVLAVASAQGIKPRRVERFDPMGFAEGAPDGAKAFLPPQGGRYSKITKPHSGMWRDLALHKRGTEVDALLSRIASLGAPYSLPCTLLRSVVRMIGEIERGERIQTDDNLLELQEQHP